MIVKKVIINLLRAVPNIMSLLLFFFLFRVFGKIYPKEQMLAVFPLAILLIYLYYDYSNEYNKFDIVKKN